MECCGPAVTRVRVPASFEDITFGDEGKSASRRRSHSPTIGRERKRERSSVSPVTTPRRGHCGRKEVSLCRRREKNLRPRRERSTRGERESKQSRHATVSTAGERESLPPGRERASTAGVYCRGEREIVSTAGDRERVSTARERVRVSATREKAPVPPVSDKGICYQRERKFLCRRERGVLATRSECL